MTSISDAQRAINVIRSAVSQATENGATVELIPAIIYSSSGYSATAYIGGSEYLTDSIRVPAGSYVSSGDYVIVGRMGEADWIDEILPYSMYSKLAIDANSGRIYIGNGSSPMSSGSYGEVLHVGPYYASTHEAAHIHHDTTWAAKGDLIVGTGNDAAAILSVGTDDKILMADSSQSTGVKWVGSETPTATALVSAEGTADTYSRGNHEHKHGFIGGSIFATATDAASAGTNGTVTTFNVNGSTLSRIEMPMGGAVVGISVRISPARTSGTLTFQVYNETISTALSLSAAINSSNTNDASASAAIGSAGNSFSSGDKLSIRSTVTSGTFAPATADVLVIVTLAFSLP